MAIDFKELFSKLIKKNDDNKKLKEKSENVRSHRSNIVLFITTFVIIVTFVLAFGTTEGMVEFKNNLFKAKIKNQDGSYAIPADAQSKENMSRRKPTDLYLAKVMGTLIQLNRDDQFNQNIQNILRYENFQSFSKIPIRENVS